MSFTLPSLPYDYVALEPFIDCQTLYVHHQKHHQTYVSNLNKALKDSGASPSTSLVETLASANAQIHNNGGGHYNHSLYWKMFCKPGASNVGPTGNLKRDIEGSFGSLDALKESFTNAALTQFGSGYAWLGVESSLGKNGETSIVRDATTSHPKLCVVKTANQDNPIVPGMSATQVIPFMVADVWEHAYYLRYQNRRAEYMEKFWSICNWDKISQLYDEFASVGRAVPV